MSYDIEVLVSKTIHEDNYTSNVGIMYHEAFHKVKEGELNYYPNFMEAMNAGRKEALKTISLILKELTSNADYYRNMEPANGWGNYDGAVKFLSDTLHALIHTDDSYVRISC